MHEVVVASWGAHTVGSTCDGVVTKSPGHPNPLPEELLDIPLLDPLEPPDPLELEELEVPESALPVVVVWPLHAARTTHARAAPRVFMPSVYLYCSTRSGTGA
jgi:hypothetical protein